MKKIVPLVTILSLLGLPVLAQIPDVPTGPSDVGGLIRTIRTITNFFFYILIMITVIMLIWAGFEYLTAQGDPERVSKANNIIKYSLIAVGVALLAKGLPSIIASILGISAPSPY